MHKLPIPVAVLGLAALTGCAATSVPDPLDPGPGTRLLATLSAQGVQIYECRAPAAGGRPAWAFVAPEARLADAQGHPAGRHGAGPHWTAEDGSRIVGTVRARRDAPAAGDVPWLLLATRSDGPAGRFSAVTHVQRVHTAGGVAPADGCDGAAVGRQRHVPYRADYRFFMAA